MRTTLVASAASWAPLRRAAHPLEERANLARPRAAARIMLRRAGIITWGKRAALIRSAPLLSVLCSYKGHRRYTTYFREESFDDIRIHLKLAT